MKLHYRPSHSGHIGCLFSAGVTEDNQGSLKSHIVIERFDWFPESAVNLDTRLDFFTDK